MGAHDSLESVDISPTKPADPPALPGWKNSSLLWTLTLLFPKQDMVSYQRKLLFPPPPR